MYTELILQTHPSGIESYFDTIGYVGILIWFLTIDQLTPIPEEISLITIGYLASKGLIDPIWAGLISFFSLLLVDVIYYSLSRSGSRLLKKYFDRSKSGMIASYKEKLTKHLGKTVITLCFIPRMRFWNPILIGIMNLSFKRFILFDTLGLFVFTMLYISLGVIFHASLHKLMEDVESMQTIIFVSSIVIYLVIFLLFLQKRKKTEQIESAQFLKN
jgi:membrane protein DedA with SNARE-associated domain